MSQIRMHSIAVLLLSVIAASCSHKSNSGDDHATKGAKLLAAEEYADAAREFETAIQKGLSQQKYEQVYTCLGNAYNGLDEFEKSIEMHKKAIAANPDYHKSWVNLGIVYRLTDEFDEAEKCYLKALELKPDYAELHASIGVLYIHQEKYDEAVQHLEKSIELDNGLPVAWSNLALAYATIDKFEEAESALKKAVMLGYKNGPIIQERISSLKALSQESE